MEIKQSIVNYFYKKYLMLFWTMFKGGGAI